jgi:hypothetical protein
VQSSPAQPTIYAALKDTATKVGNSIILKNVNFYGLRHFPLEFSYAALDDLLRAMRENPHLFGLGGASKIYPEERDSTGQALNRRVEVRVMGVR